MSDDADAIRVVVWKRETEIEQLSARSESFRDLCADFAMAQEILSEWEASSAPEREERCAEYRQLIGELAEEIETALDAAVVIPFAKSKKW